MYANMPPITAPYRRYASQPIQGSGGKMAVPKYPMIEMVLPSGV
jgi:hypothetical protein